MNKLLSELEQLKLIVKVKMQKAVNEASKSELVNAFKVTGSNLNGSLGIGSEDGHRA